MFDDRDGYAAYYTERLWTLIPAVYRASDSNDSDTAGPLRELVERLGVQAAVVRRSIDRTYEDQSIEGCDDWVISYVGDLLATNLVAALDARSQRLDVANTIYYRRRKGTVGLLEELSSDITGWSARVVESFRRLGRTRHNFDPEIGLDRDAAVIAGLRGTRSGTQAGGFADLRHVSAATAAHTAFDEFFHTADFRRGRGSTGWYNIPKLCAFLWRLRSYGYSATTPVQDIACPGQFTFDPTGREIPLFARDVRDKAQYGDAWVTPDEWMLPTRISTPLWNEARAQLYPLSLSVLGVSGVLTDVIPDTDLRVVPERGRFQLLSALPAGTVARTTYHAGFSSEIGAGAYDRRAIGEHLPEQPTPLAPIVQGGGTALQTALTALGASGTVTIADSLTYTAVPAVTNVDDLLIRSENDERGVVRLTGAPWIFQGTTPEARLVLEGVLLSGVDVVLRGTFAEVQLFCSTFDPGEAANDTGVMPRTVDDLPLVPTTIWVEGEVAKLVIHRSITGPVRVRGAGAVTKIQASDSILQSVRTSGFGAFTAADIADAHALARQLKSGSDALTQFLRTGCPAALQAALTSYDPTTPPSAALSGDILTAMNAVVAGPALYTATRFAHIALPPALVTAAMASPTGAALARVNRLLLETAYPLELGQAGIASADAEVSLTRSTVLGRIFAHRIAASESILYGFSRADDAQHGCVRFSAYVQGSRLHQPYESVAVREDAALFLSRRFGQPDYAQLSPLADREIVSGEPGASVRAGAQNGSEMGAFSREQNPIKERGLRLKLSEYMPVGLTPVLIYVT